MMEMEVFVLVSILYITEDLVDHYKKEPPLVRTIFVPSISLSKIRQ